MRRAMENAGEEEGEEAQEDETRVLCYKERGRQVRAGHDTAIRLELRSSVGRCRVTMVVVDAGGGGGADGDGGDDEGGVPERRYFEVPKDRATSPRR